MIRAIAPTSEAKRPLDVPDALWIMFCTRSALDLPIKSRSWTAIAPRAASSPKDQPGDGDNNEQNGTDGRDGIKKRSTLPG